MEKAYLRKFKGTMKRGTFAWIFTVINFVAVLYLLVSRNSGRGGGSNDRQSEGLELSMAKAIAHETAEREFQAAGTEERRAKVASEVLELTKVNPGQEAVEQKDDRAKLFQQIWRERIWGGESRSGPGSDLRATENARGLISTAISDLHITRLLDAPCGEANWLPTIEGIGTTVHYTGAEIVPDAVVENMRKYLSRPNMRFVNLDLAVDPLPKNAFDAIHCRDALQHLPVLTGLDVIANFEQTGAKYLITNFFPEGSNIGVALGSLVGGGYYQIDPHKPPFNFSKPIMYIIEAPEEEHHRKHLAVYRLPVLHKGDGTPLILDESRKHQVVYV